jgi:fumarylpyruvate hydrolase
MSLRRISGPEFDHAGDADAKPAHSCLRAAGFAVPGRRTADKWPRPPAPPSTHVHEAATLFVMRYVIDVPAMPSLPVTGREERFPIRRVFCIGRNYAEHAREMGAAVDSSAPLFFCKPADAVVADGADVPYPSATQELHHEVEMVVALKAGGCNLDAARAAQCIFGYAVGLDLTRRDLQAAAKARSHPWDTAKAFDHSAPVSALSPADAAVPQADTHIRLEVNGQLRQTGRIGDMVHGVTDIIVALSKLFELKAGDLIFTGTPAGVAALHRGDRFRAELEGVATLEGHVV